jgi:hypothetical protein
MILQKTLPPAGTGRAKREKGVGPPGIKEKNSVMLLGIFTGKIRYGFVL